MSEPGDVFLLPADGSGSRPAAEPLAHSPSSPERPAPPTELAAEVGALVLQHPGVVRLEPTLATTGLRALRLRQGTDGVQVSVRGDLVDVEVNLATGTSGSARDVAAGVRDLVAGHLAERALVAGSIMVNVLRIDR